MCPYASRSCPVGFMRHEGTHDEVSRPEMVAVEINAPDLTPLGIDTHAVQDHITRRLRQHGIAVTEMATPDVPHLRLTIAAAAQHIDAIYSVATEMHLLEPVTMRRTESPAYAVTWLQANRALYGATYLPQGTRQAVDSLLDQFLHATSQSAA